MLKIKNNYKLFIKELVGSAINFNSIFKSITKDRFYIFCFHEITNKPSKFQSRNKLFISEKNFKKQIGYITKLFNVISPIDINKKKKFQILH